MKRIPTSPTTLDRKVAAFLTRIGMSGPLEHMRAHTVQRYVDGLTIITVELIADGLFDTPPAPPACGRTPDGVLHCRPANACDDCPLYNLEVTR